MDVTITVLQIGEGVPSLLVSWSDPIEPQWPDGVPENLHHFGFRAPGAIGHVGRAGQVRFRPTEPGEDERLRAGLRSFLERTNRFDFGFTTGSGAKYLVRVRGFAEGRPFGGEYELLRDSRAFFGDGAAEWAAFASTLLEFAALSPADWPCLTAVAS